MKVIVYIQTGCPACEEFLPIVRAARPAGLQVVNISHAAGARQAMKHHIRVTPTTDVITDRGTVIRRTGLLPPEALALLFKRAR